MNIKTQILIAAVVAVSLLGIVSLVKRNKIQLKYALMWCGLDLVILLLGLFPEGTAWLARVSGIHQHINMIFFGGFCFLLLMVFALTMIVSQLSLKLKRTTQELGLLGEKLDELSKRLRENEPPAVKKGENV